MGRAVLVCLISSLFFTHTPTVYGDYAYSDWEDFADQYQLLIQDGRHSLASKLMNKRLPELETYMKDQSEEVQEVWKQISKPFYDEVPSIDEAVDLRRFVEFLYASDQETWVDSQWNLFRNDVIDVYLPSEEIKQKWDMLYPFFSLNQNEERLSSIDVTVTQLSQTDTISTRQHLVKQMEEEKVERTFQENAFMVTIFIIGGAIILTLVYVAGRRFVANKKTASKRSENS